jgi:multiple sugar transport system ATP-binding protein
VTRVERLGDQTRLHLALGGHALTTLADPHTPLAQGDRVPVRAEGPLYFDAEGARVAGGGQP